MGKKEVEEVKGKQFGYLYHNSVPPVALYYYYIGIVSQPQ